MGGLKKALMVSTLSVAIGVSANWRSLKEYFKPEHIQKSAVASPEPAWTRQRPAQEDDPTTCNEPAPEWTKRCKSRRGFVSLFRTHGNCPQAMLNKNAFPFSQFDINPRSMSHGKYRGPQNYPGKVVVLNFWRVFCEPCFNEMPEFQRLFDKYRQQGLVVLALESSHEPSPPPRSGLRDEPQEDRDRILGLGLTFPVLGTKGSFALSVRTCEQDEHSMHYDYPAGSAASYTFDGQMRNYTGEVVSNLYGVAGLTPITMIIDRQGIIRWVKIGATTAAELEREIAPYL